MGGLLIEKRLLGDSWFDVLAHRLHTPHIQSLEGFLNEEVAQGKQIFPGRERIFQAFQATPYEDVRVVIIGQDPYPTPGHAHGLAFSVLPEVSLLPKSLKNIFAELESDLGIVNTKGYLLPWSQQGVLLLNAVLTVEAGRAGSHANKGWEAFTDEVIAALNEGTEGLVFVLWGAYAQKKGKNIDRARHHVIESAHPSPLSAYRGFFGSRPFSQINGLLREGGSLPIDWQL